MRNNSNTIHLKGLPVAFVQLDYENLSALETALTQQKYIYISHAAGITKANTEDEYYLANNIYSANLAIASNNSREYLKRFIFISSMAAAGSLKGTIDLIDENRVPNPVTAYGRSKLNAEKSLGYLNLPLTILRPTAIYGPRERDLFIITNY